MARVAVVYFSGSGHTHLMAEAIEQGAGQVGETRVDLLRITGEQITNGRWREDGFMDTLNQATAIIFGSPTYMGGVAAQFKAFLDAASGVWFRQGWQDKIAGGFTHSGSPSGDKQGTLLYLAINAAQHGMIWVGSPEMPDGMGVNRLGSFLGVMGQSPLDMSGQPATLEPGDGETAKRYGQRIARIAQGWQDQA
ncbi:NADPH-dependent FMN reductase [Gloeomargarita lithophora Alchichica-D10]|uniref:NADPH-dependent FMN reductase n=1 Tax=Gloeomargarita lithophora Alchichica-D10 TaxID=1188229 RepID=A0A1J0AAS9_9CYAN|nr:flavodoxin family protein [Gloeomargarita lithophora]APB33038.1 NADPH-dependent FMN reductase [Gloeomargarita lithophora Alchichica-D10]